MNNIQMLFTFVYLCILVLLGICQTLVWVTTIKTVHVSVTKFMPPPLILTAPKAWKNVCKLS